MGLGWDGSGVKLGHEWRMGCGWEWDRNGMGAELRAYGWVGDEKGWAWIRDGMGIGHGLGMGMMGWDRLRGDRHGPAEHAVDTCDCPSTRPAVYRPALHGARRLPARSANIQNSPIIRSVAELETRCSVGISRHLCEKLRLVAYRASLRRCRATRTTQTYETRLARLRRKNTPNSKSGSGYLEPQSG